MTGCTSTEHCPSCTGLRFYLIMGQCMKSERCFTMNMHGSCLASTSAIW